METPRAEAIRLGAITYLGGRQCRRGHEGARYTASGHCVDCARLTGRGRYIAARPLRIAKQKERYKRITSNMELRREYVAQRRDMNRRYKGIPSPARPEPAHCECCGGPPNGRYNRLHVDHDYKTGLFRGWLCFKCNAAIGLLGDSTEGLRRALNYIEGNPNDSST